MNIELEKKKNINEKGKEKITINNDKNNIFLEINSPLDSKNTVDYLISKYGKLMHENNINGMIIFIFSMTQNDYIRLFENYFAVYNGKLFYKDECFGITNEERNFLLNVKDYKNADVIIYLNYILTERNKILENLSSTYADNILTALKYIKGKLFWHGVDHEGIHGIAKETFKKVLQSKLIDKDSFPWKEMLYNIKDIIHSFNEIRFDLEYHNESIYCEDHILCEISKQELLNIKRYDYKIQFTTCLFILFNKFIYDEVCKLRKDKKYCC